MRVAVDITSLHDARTGVGTFTGEVLTRLAATPGVECVAFSVSWRGRGILPDAVPDGVRVATRPMAARPLRELWRRSDLAPIEWWTGPVDVVLGPNYVVPPARRAGRLAVVHDLTPWRFPELCTRDTLQYPGLVGRAVATGAHVLTDTHAVADEIRATLHVPDDRLHVAHLGPPAGGPAGDAERGRVRAGGAPYVLVVGTIEPRKDHPTLVAAFDRLAADRPELRLVVAGQEGWGAGAVDAAVAAAAHRDRIVRTGYVDDALRADLLAGAAVVAHPAVYEGFGLPPLEAMAAGRPVVATDIAALREVLGDAALLVEPKRPDAMAAALARVLDDDALAADLVARGRARAAGFSWDAAAAGVLDALRAAATSTPNHRTRG